MILIPFELLTVADAVEEPEDEEEDDEDAGRGDVVLFGEATSVMDTPLLVNAAVLPLHEPEEDEDGCCKLPVGGRVVLVRSREML